MKFILIKKQELSDKSFTVRSDADTQYFGQMIGIPPKQIDIILVNNTISADLLQAITPYYLRGTQIAIDNVTFPRCTKNPQYFYIWQDKVPSSLPEHLKTAYANFQLRGELYQELVEWNNERINKAIKCSKFKWELAENFYKEVYKKFNNTKFENGIRVFSPNAKTRFEANAEKDFEAFVPSTPELSADEQAYLDIADLLHYSRAFGLQDTTIRVGMQHRTTEHGSTNEPILVSKYDIEQAVSSISFNKSENRELEGYENADGSITKIWKSTSSTIIKLHNREKENIETLKYFLSLPKSLQEDLLMPGWHFCPICGKLYNENDGCYDLDGNCHIEPIEFVSYNDETHDNDYDDMD